MVVKPKSEEHENCVEPGKSKMETGTESCKLKTELLPPTNTSPRNKSPVTVQQWIDALPIEENGQREEEMPSETEATDAEVEILTLGAEAVGLSRPCPTVQITSCGPWAGTSSDAGSHCSSMESLLEARKPDPEEMLMELGFGGSHTPDILQRIPVRFLQPSTLKGVAIDDFLKHQQRMADTFESGFSGYRGLQGPSHSMPSGIVGKIMERLVERGGGGGGGAVAPRHQRHHRASPRFAKVAHNLLNRLRVVRESVLSPDNRKWLESQGERSPEPRGRRLIIGQRSFSLSKDGDIIESPNRSKSASPISMCKEEVKGNKEEELNEGKSESEDEENESSERSFEAEQLEVEYKSLNVLAAQLKNSGLLIEIGSREKFLDLTPEERRSLEVSLIERALAIYEKRLKELDVRSHLEELLTGQLTNVTDLLESTTTPSLLTVVTQMTKLLRHQDSLREELKMHKTGVSQSV